MHVRSPRTLALVACCALSIGGTTLVGCARTPVPQETPPTGIPSSNAPYTAEQQQAADAALRDIVGRDRAPAWNRAGPGPWQVPEVEIAPGGASARVHVGHLGAEDGPAWSAWVVRLKRTPGGWVVVSRRSWAIA